MVTRFMLLPTVLVVVPALVALQLFSAEEDALAMFVLTRPFGPAVLACWAVLARPLRRILRSDDEALAGEIGAKSASGGALASYLGIFLPFMVFCVLSALCAIVNTSGPSTNVVVRGQVERVDFGRWTRSYSVTVQKADRTAVTLPIASNDAIGLQPGSTFTKQYKRGTLGILYLP